MDKKGNNFRRNIKSEYESNEIEGKYLYTF